MTQLFQEVFIRPLFNGLILIYHFLPFKDVGVAIIVLTCGIRLLLHPFFRMIIAEQAKLQKIQPRVQEIQKNHAQDFVKQGEELMKVYRDNNVKPGKIFLVTVVQLPLLLAVFRVFSLVFDPAASSLTYPSLSYPTELTPFFLGFINLKNPSIILAGLIVPLQILQLYRSNQAATKEAKFFNLLFLGIIFSVLFGLPSVIALYWLVSVVWGLLEEALVKRALASGKT